MHVYTPSPTRIKNFFSNFLTFLPFFCLPFLSIFSNCPNQEHSFKNVGYIYIYWVVKNIFEDLCEGMQRKALSQINITIPYSDHRISLKARNSKQMSSCIHLLNSEYACLFGHGKLTWGFTLDSVGNGIRHLCNNHNGHAPTIILPPPSGLMHTSIRTAQARALRRHPGNYFHTCFLCIYIPVSFICVHKNNAKAFEVIWMIFENSFKGLS